MSHATPSTAVIDSTKGSVRYVGPDFQPIFVEDQVTEVQFCAYFGCPKVATRGKRVERKFCQLHYLEWTRFLNRMAQRRWQHKQKEKEKA